MQKENVTSIVIAGVGGQGNILASKIIAECARLQSMNVIVGEIFAMSQRGGSVESHVRIGDGALSGLSPKHSAQIICGLEPMEALRAADQFIRPDGIVVTDNRPYNPVAVNMGKAAYPPIDLILKTLKTLCRQVTAFDATVLAERAGGVMSANMVMLGALSNVKRVGLFAEAYVDAIRRIVPKGVEMNLKAFRFGREVNLGSQN